MFDLFWRHWMIDHEELYTDTREQKIDPVNNREMLANLRVVMAIFMTDKLEGCQDLNWTTVTIIIAYIVK